MFKPIDAFSGYSVDDFAKAKAFYADVLGLKVDEDEMGLTLHLPGGGSIFIYKTEKAYPATYTILNFKVENIDEAVDALVEKGVTFERYEDMGDKQDEKGIMRGLSVNMGPSIAWFKDPAGNIFSVLQEK